MKTKIFSLALGALFFSAPLLASATYNDVSLGTSAIISAGGASLTITGSADVIESIVVDTNSFNVTLQTNSILSINSADSYNLSYTSSPAATFSTTCSSSGNSMVFSGSIGQVVVTITPDSGTTCTIPSTTTTTTSLGNGPAGGGGGGGGGGGSYVPIVATVPAQTTTSQTTSTGGSGLASVQIDAIISLLQSFGADQSVIDNVRVSLTGSATASVGYTFARTLKVGSSGADVKELQKFLNRSADTQVSVSGTGSPGNETTLLGNATSKAIGKFQLKYGIAKKGDSGFGLFGPKTKAKVNELMK